MIVQDAAFVVSRVQCLPADKDELCVRLNIDGVPFCETLYDEPFAISAPDSKRRGTTRYMNEGPPVWRLAKRARGN